MSKPKNYLNRDRILQIDDRPVLELEVPEWGGTLRVRALSGADRDRMEDALNQKMANNRVAALLLSLSAVDEQNKPLFSLEDIELLPNKAGEVLARLTIEILKHNRMRSEDLEQAEKN